MSCAPIAVGAHLIVATSRQTYAFDLQSGRLAWSRKNSAEELNFHWLSVINGELFESIDNAICRVEPRTGKILHKQKYRVHWLSGALVLNDGRFFVASSNSKILELDPQSLKPINQFKFPGGWSVRAEPQFLAGRMISTFYGASAVAFELASGEVAWRSAKLVGAEGSHASDPDTGRYFHSSNRADQRTAPLIGVDVASGKRLWALKLLVEKFCVLPGGELLAVINVDERNGQFQVVRVDPASGKITENLLDAELRRDPLPGGASAGHEMVYRLDTGVEFGVGERSAALAIQPGVVHLLEY